MPLEQNNELEPRLSYSRFGSDVPTLVGNDDATALGVSDRVLALGAASGAVHILDYEGDRIKTWHDHTAPVTDLSFDDSAETLAVGFADGHIVVRGVHTEEVAHYTVKHPVTCIAIDPRYSMRKTQEFIYGTAAGSLILSSRGWLGNTETVLFQGKGPVHAVRRSGPFLAWATETGVRIYDTSSHIRVGRIDRSTRQATKTVEGTHRASSSGENKASSQHQQNIRDGPQKSPDASSVSCDEDNMQPPQSGIMKTTAATSDNLSRCLVEWVGQRTVLLGWDRQVIVATLVPSKKGVESIIASAALGVPSPRVIGPESHWNLEISARFDVSFGIVAGVAPFGRQVAVLTWHSRSSGKDEEGTMTAASGTVPCAAALRIYDRNGRELFMDPLVVGSLDASSMLPQVKLAGYFGDSVAANGSGTLGTLPLEGGSGVASGEEDHQPFQWWPDGAEPMYYILASKHRLVQHTWISIAVPLAQDVVVGRPRTPADRIQWLSERHRFVEALTIAESDSRVSAQARADLVKAYLHDLMCAGKYQEAATQCSKLLGKDEIAWERWVYTFAQQAQLPILAPLLPTSAPTLSSAAYDLALTACLRAPEDHNTLLQLVRSWPAGIYDARGLLQKLQARLRPSSTPGASAATATTSLVPLRAAAAALHTQLGEHAAALRLLIDIRSRDALDYVVQRALAPEAASMAASLIDIDEVKATSLLVEIFEEAPPAAVVASLQEAVLSAQMIDAPRAQGGAAGAVDRKSDGAVTHPSDDATTPDSDSDSVSVKEDIRAMAAVQSPPVRYTRAQGLWRRRLYHYLDLLWHQEPSAAAPFAMLHVELCADHDPGRLLALLTSSSSYPLDAALWACESRGLVRESVYVLGRMGSSEAALRLIVERLKDIAAAVEFVQEQRDSELSDMLIALVLGDAALAGELLDHASGAVEPLKLVSALPEDMQIDRLRERLSSLMVDVKAAAALQRGCNAALRADCLDLADRLYREVRQALRIVHVAMAGFGDDAADGGKLLKSSDVNQSVRISNVAPAPAALQYSRTAAAASLHPSPRRLRHTE